MPLRRIHIVSLAVVLSAAVAPAQQPTPLRPIQIENGKLLGVLTAEIHLHGAFWNVMANFNINLAGFCIAGLFVAVWAVALIYWRVGNVEDKWTAGMASAPVSAAPARTVQPPDAAPAP